MRKYKEILPVYADFGRRIRESRISSGLKCSALSKKAGVPEEEISAIEDGRRRPAGKTIDRLADALGVSRMWLLTGISPEIVNEQIKREELSASIMNSFIAGKIRFIDKNRTVEQVLEVESPAKA
ncbi:MAG: helix-turn-helix transcriptional regulator [Rickettsiales bacterium]|nr:helix-turn-helix transcriptional regulator [Rickettsiales bacterium]